MGMCPRSVRPTRFLQRVEAQLARRGARQAVPLKIRHPERQKKRETESAMYTRKGILARTTCNRLLADRDQAIAPAIKRMTRINDFHLFAGGYVIITPMGISRRPRAYKPSGPLRSTPRPMTPRAR